MIGKPKTINQFQSRQIKSCIGFDGDENQATLGETQEAEKINNRDSTI